MNTRTEPTLANNTASAEHHIVDELTIIDWATALPRRPGDRRPKTQPVIRTLPMIRTLPVVYTPQHEPPAQPARAAPKTTSIGSGIVKAALIVTLGPICITIALAVTILTLTGYKWF